MFLIGSLYKDMKVLGAMASNAPGIPLAAATTTVGATIDTQGFARMLFALFVGTITTSTSLTWQLFHGDASNMSDEAQVSASDLNGTLPVWDIDGDDSTETVEYICRKRYCRLKLVSVGTVSVDLIGAIALHGQAGKMPQQT